MDQGAVFLGQYLDLNPKVQLEARPHTLRRAGNEGVLANTSTTAQVLGGSLGGYHSKTPWQRPV